MKNVEMKVEGKILTIKVDLTREFGPSSSGKTIIIASTEGNVTVDGVGIPYKLRRRTNAMELHIVK